MKKVIILVAIAGMFAGAAQAALIGWEAEDGTSASGTVSATLGAEFDPPLNDPGALGGAYITTETGSPSGNTPASDARTVSYSIDFTEAGTYDLYARLLVVQNNADDSLYYAREFGDADPTHDGGTGLIGWCTVNGIWDDYGAGEYVWINLSTYASPFGESPSSFTVGSAGTLNWELGGREDGLWIDALAFGTSGETFTDAQLDTAVRGIPAHNPSPAHNAAGILPTTTLTWEAGLDQNDLTKVNPAIKKHYVWMSNGNPADPNLLLVATVDVTNYNDPAADGIYDPTPDLITDGFYYWMVEEGLDNGVGGAYPAGDPNNLVSTVWMFDTSTLPLITAQPVSVRVGAGQTAVFEVGFDSISSASVTWYKDGAPLPAGGDITIDTDLNSSTLTISNADNSDDAEYYAVVKNNGGSSETDTVHLSFKKLLAWYQFEQNADDSAGTNNGTVMGGMVYTAGKITDDGQAYAADPNGTNYVELTTDAYPKGGFGDGLDAFTYSCWVNLDPGEGGIILGEFNDGSTTGLRFSINSVENDISVYMRQEGGSSINPRSSALATDSQWHHVAVTYDGSEMKIYVDGSWRTTSTRTLTNFVDWQRPLVLLAVNSRGSINDRFTGQVDDLKIYNYAFTSAEIAQAYLGVEGGWICDTELPELVYDFDDNCQIDLGDLVLLATTWLDSNRVYEDGI